MSPTICPSCGSATREQPPVAGNPLYACISCRLEFLHPQPDDAALAAIYGRHYYDSWGIGSDEAGARRIKMASFRQLLTRVGGPLPPSARVLDVGCATGYFLEAARELGLDAYGVEVSQFGAEASRRKVGASKVHHGTLEDASFDGLSDGQFDAVFMSDLIEHVRVPQRQLEAAHRQLKPDGLLVITTPWTGTLLHLLSGSRWVHYKPEHLFYFGADNLPSLLAGAGFRLVRILRAEKCLSLAYARSQFNAGGTAMRLIARLLGFLPDKMLKRELWISIGEATLIAQRI